MVALVAGPVPVVNVTYSEFPVPETLFNVGPVPAPVPNEILPETIAPAASCANSSVYCVMVEETT